ncbi:hypothetical protein [Actinoplanes campanulatus]|uniref:hypothetical protein n=1 Tax=Actinoplanes campanulatus TaxID=113559 RepID=UPI0031D620FD
MPAAHGRPATARAVARSREWLVLPSASDSATQGSPPPGERGARAEGGRGAPGFDGRPDRPDHAGHVAVAAGEVGGQVRGKARARGGPGQRGGHRRRRAGFRQQRQSRVEDDAGRSPGDRGRRGVRADAAPRPHRHTQFGEQLLEQDEDGQSGVRVAGLGAPGEQAVGAVGDRGAGLDEAGHLGQHGPAAPGRGADPGRHDHGVHLFRQVRRRQGGVHPYPEPARHPPRRPPQFGGRRAVVSAEIQHALHPGPAAGGQQPPVREPEGGDGHDRCSVQFGAVPPAHPVVPPTTTDTALNDLNFVQLCPDLT